MAPSVFVTAAHHHAGLKRDAASVWIEDVTQSSFKVCLRELQNYAGSHEDVYVVSIPLSCYKCFISLQKRKTVFGLFCFPFYSIYFFAFVFIEWSYFSETSLRSMSRT